MKFFKDRFDPKRVFGLIRKEVAVLRKDKAAMVIIFAIPIVLVLSINFGRDMNIRENPVIGIIDLDNSEGYPGIDLSVELVKVAIEADINNSIDLVIGTNETLLNYQLAEGKISSIIVIPEGFEYNLSIHFPSIITVKIDGMDMLKYIHTQEEIDNLIKIFRSRFKLTGVFDPVTERVNRPKETTRLFEIAPFFFPWTLFSIATLVACQVIVSDVPKHRMALTPTNKMEIIVSKIAGIQVLMTILSIILIAMSMTIGGLVIRSSLIDYFINLWIVSLAGVTLGTALSALSKTPLAALQFFIFFFLLQAIVIYFIPWEEILSIFPVYNGQYIFQNVIIRGMNPFLPSVSIYYTNIFLFIAITFTIGYLLYRKIPTIV